MLILRLPESANTSKFSKADRPDQCTVVILGFSGGSLVRLVGSTNFGRAETYDTMLAWYDDIKNLIDKTGDERNAFVRRHARSISAGSARSVSSDGGLEEDEADEVPFSASQSVTNQATQEAGPPQRPSPGGRFPSDIQVDRNLQAPLAPSSGSSSEVGHDITTAPGGLHVTHFQYTAETTYDPAQQPQLYATQHPYQYNSPYQQSVPAPVQQQTPWYVNNPPPTILQNGYDPSITSSQLPPQAPEPQPQPPGPPFEPSLQRHDSTYGEWMAPAAAGAAAGAIGTEAYHQQQQKQKQEQKHEESLPQQTEPPIHNGITPQPPSENHAEHPATPAPAAAAPIPVASEADSLVTTPSTAAHSFLAGPEAVPAAASSKASFMNGGPPVAPGVRRNNTDVSVSDLHVPGEYPRVHAA